jgi:putative zincin peptidase
MPPEAKKSQEPIMVDRTLSSVTVNTAGIIMALAFFAIVIVGYMAVWHENPLALYSSSQSTAAVLIVTLVIFFVSITVHEVLHMVGYRLGGVPRQQIRFGFQWKALTPYVHCSAALPARAYRLAVVLPGIVLGLIPLVVGFAGHLDWMVLYGTAMLAGAAGDLLILLLMLPIGGDTLIRDHATKPGFQILPQPEED